MRKAKAKSVHEEREHAPYPPSASSRWLKCLPSQEYIRRLIATKNIVKRVSGPAAQRGTRIHELAEPVLRDVIVKGKRLYKVTGPRDEADEADAYVKFCLILWGSANMLGDAKVWIETRSKVTDLTWGSNDFSILAAKRLTVVDLKSGFEPVEVEGNTQLIIYAMGIIREIVDKMMTGTTPRQVVREVELIIWQPNADPGNPDRGKVYTIDEFMKVAIEVERGINAAEAYHEGEHSFQELQKALVAGPWCTWCDALGVCPKAAKHAQAVSAESFAPVLRGEDPQLPEPASLTPAQISQVIERSKLFTEWIEALKERAIELMRRGEKVPGYKVVAAQTHRKWLETTTPAKVAKATGLKIEQVLEAPKMRSPSQVEELLPKKQRDRTTGLWFKPFAQTIARESDRRDPIDNTKVSFQPVTRDPED